MLGHGKDEVEAAQISYYDRESELKAFDETKEGVKGLVDAGITKVPPIFIHSYLSQQQQHSDDDVRQFVFPVIDMEGIEDDIVKLKKRKDIVEKNQRCIRDLGFLPNCKSRYP